MPVEHLGPRSLRQLLDTVIGIGSELDLDRALRRIVEAAASLVDARYGALGVLDESRSGLSQFITVGLGDDEVRAIGQLPKGLGLLGLLIVDARPLRVPDVADHPARAGFPPNHPPMTSFLGVPIVVRGEVFGNLYLTDKASAETFSDIDEELVTGLAAAAGVVIENARLHGTIRRREAALSATHEILRATAESTDDRSTLKLLAERARELTAADAATIARATGPSGDLVMDVVAGDGFAGLTGHVFAAAGSVSGEVMATGQSVVLQDTSRDYHLNQPQVSSGEVGPAMWVALNASGDCVGTLSVVRSRGSQPFGEAELELLLLFAIQAGFVLELEQNRQGLMRLSTLEDRERIARDLHDTVIQRLFATGLSLQSVLGVAENDTLRERVSSAVDDLDVTVRHIRTVIFGLERPVAAPTIGLRSRTLDLSAEAARALGFEPHVAFRGPLDTTVGGPLADAMLAVLREALSNVARHACARHVAVEVAADSTALVLTVTDDGVGLDRPQSGGSGLANMRARAETFGGGLEIRPVTTGGVSVRWRALLAP